MQDVAREFIQGHLEASVISSLANIVTRVVTMSGLCTLTKTSISAVENSEHQVRPWLIAV